MIRMEKMIDEEISRGPERKYSRSSTFVDTFVSASYDKRVAKRIGNLRPDRNIAVVLS